MASTTLLPPNGDRLLRQLVAGAAGSLRRLDLHSSAVDGDLSMLAAATALTWLNLAGGCAGCCCLDAPVKHSPCCCSLQMQKASMLFSGSPDLRLLTHMQARACLTTAWQTWQCCRSNGCPSLRRGLETRALGSCWPCRWLS